MLLGNTIPFLKLSIPQHFCLHSLLHAHLGFPVEKCWEAIALNVSVPFYFLTVHNQIRADLWLLKLAILLF